MNIRKIIITIFIILIAIALFRGGFSFPSQETRELNFSEFSELVEKGQVDSAYIDNFTAKGKLVDGTSYTAKVTDRNIANYLVEQGVKVELNDPSQGSFWLTILSWAPLLILGLVFFLFMQQAQGGGAGS